MPEINSKLTIKNTRITSLTDYEWQPGYQQKVDQLNSSYKNARNYSYFNSLKRDTFHLEAHQSPNKYFRLELVGEIKLTNMMK